MEIMKLWKVWGTKGLQAGQITKELQQLFKCAMLMTWIG